MNCEPEIIRARFVEAASTERFLAGASVPTCRGYWPEFIHNTEDKAGWDDAAHLDNAARRSGRASTGAISRHQECLNWTGTIITDEIRRHVLWSWAFCRANGWDFGARCNRRGWKRPTAYRRLNASIEAICHKLRMESAFVRLPDDKWLRHEDPVMASVDGTMGRSNEQAAAVKFTPGYRTEQSRDLIQSQADADTFAKFLERRNADMRRSQEQEAKRRAKLGMDAV